MNKKDIIVVIPFYLSTLSVQEEVSLRQCLNVLTDYSIVAIKPESLDMLDILARFPIDEVVTFPDDCFRGIESYNRLVLDANFYKVFSAYSYMLIYQLDAYVFKDELFFWASLGYDYIGAPWMPHLRKHWQVLGKCLWALQRSFWRMFCPRKMRKMKACWYHVGNGGLSLRKISKMIKVTEHYRERIDRWLGDGSSFFPEDVLLLLLTPRRGEFRLKRPSYKLAMKFCIEHIPAWTYRANGCQLPFGCHNWTHPEMLPFWTQFIKY